MPQATLESSEKAIIDAPREQRFVIGNVDWDTYQGFARLMDERPIRITYDRGALELMTLSFLHEWLKELLGQFIEALTEELKMPRKSAGSTTFGREILDRGLEADRCYYLEHEPLIRGKQEIDLQIDPPPDLAVEIEVSRSALDRLGIYAALRVPEVWCYNGQKLRVYQLGEDGRYTESDHSRHFPHLPLAELEAFLSRRDEMDEGQLVRDFRQWVRDQIARGWK